MERLPPTVPGPQAPPRPGDSKVDRKRGDHATAPHDARLGSAASGHDRSDLGAVLPAGAVPAGLSRRFALRPGEPVVRDGPPPGMLGAARGNEIALGPEARADELLGRVVAAHELAHLQDMSAGSEVEDERRADRTAVDVLLGREPRSEPGAIVSPLRLRGCKKPPAAADRARAALDQFAAMSAADQATFVATHYRSGSYAGTIRSHLEALPAEERTGRYRDTIRTLLQLVQRQEVRASTGMTDAQMAGRQATFMDAEALAAAQAATGSATPTPAQQSQAHQQSVQQLNLPARTTNRWDALPPPPDPAQANFRLRAASAVTGIVNRAAVVAPELHITAAHLHFSPETIDRATDSRYAEYDSANNRLNFGMDFTDAATSNPDYVMGVVVHEVFGHGEYGGIRDSYELELYGQARPLATGALTAAERAAPLTSSERFGYGYQGTEIYSELREAQYDVRAPAASGVVQGDRAVDDVRNRVGLIKDKWEGTVARGILRGMYARFALDPRITPSALQLFVAAVDHHFPGENLLAPRP